MNDMLAEQFTGLKSGKKPAHRGHRSRGKGSKVDAHAEAKEHIAAAHASTDPAETHRLLFKAVSSLKKC